MDIAIAAQFEPINVPVLLQQYGIRPTKGLGQNFLIDEEILASIVEAADVAVTDDVLEIGPGLGALTRHLARKANRVVAVEIDSQLLRAMRKVVSGFDNLDIIQADILKLDLSAHFDSPGYLVVANIPYYITSALIRHLLEASVKPKRVVLTVQKEVAQRMVAKPGKLSLLALSVQVYGQPQLVANIPASAFYPAPKIDSAVVRTDLYPQPLIPPEQMDTFFRLAKAGFSQKRKTLANSLSAGLSLPKSAVQAMLTSIEIDPGRRAQTLSIAEWGLLTKLYLQ